MTNSIQTVLRFTIVFAAFVSLISCGGGGGSSSATSNGGGGTPTTTYTVGGQISGISGSITLLNNGENALTLGGSGSFTFTAPLSQGANYAVTISSQPAGQTCSIKNGSGTNIQANITNVIISCLSIGKFVYSPNLSGDTLTGFSINQSTGALTPIPGSPFPAGSVPQNVAVTPSGKFAYVTNLGGSSISQYSVNPTTGALTSIGPDVSSGFTSQVMIIDPSGKFLYVTNNGPGTITILSIDQTTGLLTVVGSASTGRNPYSLAINPAGTILYVGNLSDGTISVFSIDQSTGALRAIAGSPFVTSPGPRAMVVSPSGANLYVSGGDGLNPASDLITIFSIDQVTGGLLASSTYASGYTISLAIDPTGQFLYSVGDGDLSGFSIDGGNGSLSPLSGSPYTTGADPLSVAMDSSGKFIYVANNRSNNISAFSVNSTTGALSSIGTYASGSGPNGITTTAGPR
jgi:6-phosphogluconolactonase (cycloisomerase 2 family)